jgi:phosphatidylglycerophosphatase A
MFKRLLTSCFGIGFIPFASGTWGSLPPVCAFFLMAKYIDSPATITLYMALIALVATIITVCLSSAAIKASGKDPSEVVSDEVAGQALTCVIIAPLQLTNILLASLLAFIFFRLFDIIKPWPIHKLEKLPAGYGICADDLLAGVFAGLVVLIISFAAPQIFASCVLN